VKPIVLLNNEDQKFYSSKRSAQRANRQVKNMRVRDDEKVDIHSSVQTNNLQLPQSVKKY
jgi:hypothetical protein